MPHGDTLYNYEEEYVFEVVATNTYGCASSLSTNLVFPGTFDLVDMDIQWLNAHTVALNVAVERASLWDVQGRLLWSQTLGGSTQFPLPLQRGDGWRLVTLELSGGGTVRQSIVR